MFLVYQQILYTIFLGMRMKGMAKRSRGQGEYWVLGVIRKEEEINGMFKSFYFSKWAKDVFLWLKEAKMVING